MKEYTEEQKRAIVEVLEKLQRKWGQHIVEKAILEEEKKDMKKEVPVEQITDNGFTYWVSNSHIEEYPEEPTRWQMIKELLRDMVRNFLSKLKQ